MISSVSAVGKIEETHAAAKPLNDEVRTNGAAGAHLQQAPDTTLAIPPVYVGGFSDVSDFVYTESGHMDTKVPSAGSVSVPGIGVIPGLSDQSYTGSAVKYEIKVGGVLVARVFENGVMVAVEGFDYAHMGFPSPEERGLTGGEVADSRTSKFASYLTSLSVKPEISTGLALNADGQPATSQTTVNQLQNEAVATPFGITYQQNVVSRVVPAG